MNYIKKIGNWFKKSKARIIITVAVVLFCTATIIAAAANSYRVTVYYGENVKTITTMKSSADEIIEQAGFTVNSDDIIDLDDFSDGTDSVIHIYPTCTIKIYDNNNTCKEYKANGLVADALTQCGIILNDGDLISCENTDEIYSGMEIVITRAFPVTITADGQTVTVNLAQGNVGDALDKAVITVDDDDILSHPLDTVLTTGMTIKVTRVEYKERTATEKIAYAKKTTKDSTLYTDQYKITQKGVDGEKTVTYKDKYVDGKLTESKATKTVVTKEAVDEIKAIGTKSRGYAAAGIKTVSYLTPPSSLKLNGKVPTSYKKKIVGTASAYSGGGRTATGKSAQPGYIAVNPNQIPYGTKLWIVSNDGKYVYGYASAEDTGGFTKWTGSRATVCDLYFASESAASAFGRRSVTIYVL